MSRRCGRRKGRNVIRHRVGHCPKYNKKSVRERKRLRLLKLKLESKNVV